MDFEHKPFYSPAEVASILGVSVSYINHRIDRGEIDAIRLSPRVTRVPYGVLRALVGRPLAVTEERRSAAEREAERDALHGEDVPAPARHPVTG
jgi:excisionase family DNA binding protein